MAKATPKKGTSFGGVYVWSTKDFNNLMSQLATIQAGIVTLSNKLASLQVAQNTAQLSLSNVQASLTKITAQETKQMSALDDLTAAVAQTQTVEQSAVTLIQGIAKQLSDALASNSAAANDPALAQLRDQLNSSAAELAAAITANTAQPAPTPAP